EAVEHGLGDLDRALGLYAKVEASGELLVEACMAMARVAGARGDKSEQRRVLLQITERAGDEVSAAEQNAALWALVELELANDAWRDAGLQTLERALAGKSDYERGKAVVRAAVARAPEQAQLRAAFERVARGSRDQGMLLEHFERLALDKDAQLAQLREGIELAMKLGENARAEALLEKAEIG